MSIYVFILLVMIISMSMHNRYFPIKSVPCIKNGFKEKNAIILDIRDYHLSGSSENHSIETLNIPYSYLKRYIKGITHHKIHLIASDQVELNLGLRFLLRKGFDVSSYEIMDCPCKTKGA